MIPLLTTCNVRIIPRSYQQVAISNHTKLKLFRIFSKKVSDDQKNTSTLLAMQTGIFTLIVLLFLGLTGFLLNSQYQKDIENSICSIKDEFSKFKKNYDAKLRLNLEELYQTTQNLKNDNLFNELATQRTLILMFESQEKWDTSVIWVSRFVRNSITLKAFDEIYEAFLDGFIDTVESKNVEIENEFYLEIIENIKPVDVTDEAVKKKLVEAQKAFVKYVKVKTEE